MKQELIDQFKSIRETLINNVDTIGKLIKQAELLSSLAEKIDGTSSTDVETKKKLTDEVNNIKQSIAKLIEQTNTLFDLYNKFADALFTSSTK